MFLGYTTQSDFLAGKNRNTSILSWNGQATANLTFQKTLDYLYKSDDSDIILDIGNFTTQFLMPYGFCKVYIGELKQFIEVKIISSVDNIEHYIFVSDPTITSHVQAYDATTRDTMRLTTNIQGGKYAEYRIKLKETEKVVNDGTCVNYPYHDHANYGDCVDAELRARILPVRGCMVPWMTNIDQCLEPIPRLPQHEDLLSWLFHIGLL